MQQNIQIVLFCCVNLQKLLHEYNDILKYLLAPVQTILPELKIRAVVLGSRILIMTAAKR